MLKDSELHVRDVMERVEELKEAPLEECLETAGEWAQSPDLADRFCAVMALSDRVLIEFGIALDSQEDTSDVAPCLLVLLEELVKSYAMFSGQLVDQNSLSSSSRYFPRLSLLLTVRPWFASLGLGSEDRQDADAFSTEN